MNRTARRALRAACLTAAVLLSLPGCTQPGDRNTADTQPDTTEAVVTEEPFTIPEDDSKMDEGYFSIAYETQSYVQVGGEIGLAADFIRHDGRDTTCYFRSLDTSVVTVTPDGRVTGVAPGTAAVRAFVNDEVYFDFPVTVLPEHISDALALALKAHNSNVFVRKELGIGDGTPVYYRDIYGSVSDLLYNEPLVIDTTYLKAGTDNTAHSDGPRAKHGFDLEYITVHYTGNMDVNATAKANADYFSWVKEVSVHYVTGNDGVFACLDDSYVSWNAGDRMTGKHLEWSATGVSAPTDGRDPAPVWGISSDGRFFTINGETTSVHVPRRQDHRTVTGTTFLYNGVECPTFNQLGLPWKIVDGEYYMGSTWWCYRTTTAGALCGIGGDYNSISIESAVNPETDLWYTWHKTAQLVAKLLVDNDLDLTRVTGHHLWTQKDCPQPMLENDLEIWHEFMDMVACEYDLIRLGNVDYTLTVVEGQDICPSADTRARMKYNGKSYNYVQKPGRVFPENDDAAIIVYDLTVTTADGTETVRLASALCPRQSKLSD